MIAFPLDHIGIVTGSISDAAGDYELLTGAPCSPIEFLPQYGANVAFIGQIELLEPLGAESTIGQFLSCHGPSLHHLAYRVPDIRALLKTLRDQGLQLIDDKPKLGARGHLVAFVHPHSAGGVLWELVEG